MKKLAILLIVVSVTLGAGVWWTGLRAQQEIRRVVAMLDAQSEIRVLETSYAPGWLESSATITFEVRGVAGAGFDSGLEALGHAESRERIGLRMAHEIEHGLIPFVDWVRAGAEGTPVVARVASRVVFDQETQAELREALGRFPELEAKLVVRASGVVEASFDMPPAPLRPRPDPEDPSSVVGQFGGLHGSAVLATVEGSAVGRFALPAIEIAGDQFRLEVTGVEVLFDGARDPSGVWVGSLTQKLAEASFAHREVPSAPAAEPESGALHGVGPPAPLDRILAAQGVALNLESQVSGPFLRAAVTVDMARATRDAPDLPGFVGQDAHLALLVEQVNAEVLGGLWLSDEIPGAPAADPPTGVSAPLEWLQKLAPSSPRLEVTELRAQTPEGALLGSGEVRLEAAQQALLSSASTYQGALSGRAVLEGPASLLGAAGSESLTSLEEQGWVELMDDRFALSLDFAGGVLQSHGEKLAWPGSTADELAAKVAPQ
jgi:hypothetical protein